MSFLNFAIKMLSLPLMFKVYEAQSVNNIVQAYLRKEVGIFIM
jgi:hypothetical protein